LKLKLNQMKNKRKSLNKKLDLKKVTLVSLTKAQEAKVFGGNPPPNPDTLAQTSLLTAGCTG
jgi:hypothetical protein